MKHLNLNESTIIKPIMKPLTTEQLANVHVIITDSCCCSSSCHISVKYTFFAVQFNILCTDDCSVYIIIMNSVLGSKY